MMDQGNSSAPLSGVTVLDIGHYLSGPWCARLLGLMGAYVIKIERPSGDPLREAHPIITKFDGERVSAAFLYANTGKSHVTLDLKLDKDHARLLDFIKTTDIVLENYSPGVLGRLGLGYDVLKQVNPKVILTSISNFGQTGPYRDYKASELELYAASGLMSISGLQGQEPIKHGLFTQAQYAAGTLSAFAALTALSLRHRTGMGSWVDVSIMETLASELIAAHCYYTYSGSVQTRQRRRDVNTDGRMGLIEAVDGSVIPSLGVADGPDAWENFTNMLGAPNLLQERFNTHVSRIENADSLIELVREAVHTKHKYELFHEANTWRFPWGVSQTLGELLKCEQLTSRKFFSMEPEGVVPQLPFNTSESWQNNGPRPFLRKINEIDSSSGRFGLNTSELPGINSKAQREKAAAPFDGIRILDLSAIWAAPYAVQLFSTNGAEVIKVEYPARPGFRLFGPFPDGQAGERFWERSGTFNLLERRKKGVTIDLTSEDGLRMFKDLVRISDVVVENYTPRVMKELGLNYENLRLIRPDLIMLSLTGYGHTGPWSNYLATGDSMEPSCGFCEVTGYAGGPPMKAGYAYVDLIASWYCASALAGALEQRRNTGIGQWLDVSMYESGVSFLGDALIAYQYSGVEPARIGNDHPWIAPHGCYPCKGEDEWVAISVHTDDQWEALCNIIGRSDLVGSPLFNQNSKRFSNRDRFRSILEAWTSGYNAKSVMNILQSSGIPAAAVFNSHDLLTDRHLASRGFYEQIIHAEHTGVGSKLYPRPPFLLVGQEMADKHPAPAPDVGEHNAQIFGDLLGCDDESISTWYKSGVLGDKPVGVSAPFKATSLDDLLRYKQLARVDVDYDARLLAAHPELEG